MCGDTPQRWGVIASSGMAASGRRSRAYQRGNRPPPGDPRRSGGFLEAGGHSWRVSVVRVEEGSAEGENLGRGGRAATAPPLPSGRTPFPRDAAAANLLRTDQAIAPTSAW